MCGFIHVSRLLYNIVKFTYQKFWVYNQELCYKLKFVANLDTTDKQKNGGGETSAINYCQGCSIG